MPRKTNSAYFFLFLVGLSTLLSIYYFKKSKVIEVPMAEKRPVKLEKFGDVRVDNYFWLKERENKEVIDYLEKENAYTKAKLEHTEDFQEKLFEEIKGRIKKDDDSVPYKKDDYYYYSRYEKGKEYPIYCRKKDSLENKEEIILDVNVLAKGHDFFSVSGLSVSTNHQILGYAVDTVGRRIYNLKFVDLATGKHLPNEIKKVTGNFTWANDNDTLFYSKQDEKTLRWEEIFRYKLSDQKSHSVYFEKDDTFSSYVYKSKTKKYIFVGSGSTLTDEVRYLNADSPEGEFKVFEPRKRKHEYSVEHAGDVFYIVSNDNAQNFRVFETPDGKTEKKHWKEIIPHSKDIFVRDVEVFKDHLVIEEREGGLTQIKVLSRKDYKGYRLEFPDDSYIAGVFGTSEYNSDTFRYSYESLTTPDSTFDYSFTTKKAELKKQKEVLGDFNKDNYVSERIFATASDGTKVPISLVARKGFKKDGKSPLLLYGYGSYGANMEPWFSSTRLSLIDRGFIYAIAHIRGGSEMGRYWYEEGKLLKKKNTFTDFIACGEHLVKEGYTSKENIFASGGSAGGLLMGAVINMRPDLFKGVIAAVPFVDIVTTMLDDSIPLTTSEYDEWGNPNKEEYYKYMKSYSPYDNVEAKDYPNMLVTTGLHDSQVQYWEPAKWVAKLRDLKTDNNVLLLDTDMKVGHGGTTGRFERLKKTVMEYAFFLDLAGISK